jgi:hypothetical protein
MSEGLSGTSPGITPAKNLITIANDHGIDVAIDLHTWHSTSNPSTYPCTWDDGFDDSYSNHEAVRDGYLTYVHNVLTSFSTSNVHSFMVLNEPQAQTASTDENNFILEVISTANAATGKPISVRFMGGYSASTGHYSVSIDAACDFICRNTYWDARYPTVTVYGTTEAKLLAARDYAHANSKEFWITEFGKPKSDEENQRSYVAAFVAWANTKSIDAVFAWASQYASTGETYNLFSGTTPNDAWYELVNQAYEEPPPGDNLVELDQPNSLETLDSYTVKFNYTATFYQGAITNSSLWANKTGTWQRLGWNATAIVNATIHSISYTFSGDAAYLWNVQVFNSTDAHWATANRTFTIETTPPPNDPPTYGDTSVSTTIAGAVATFGCLWMDDDYLSYGILSHNASGAWTNRTSVAIFAPRFTFTDSFTLPASEGVIVGYRFYANDTADQWNITAIHTLNTTYIPEPIPVTERVYGYIIYGANFSIYLMPYETLGFQHDTNKWVCFLIETGALNGTNTYVVVTQYDGYLVFKALDACSIHVTYTVDYVYVEGAMGASKNMLLNNSMFEVLSGDNIILGWGYTQASLLDIYAHLGLGIAGILLLVLSPSYVAWHIHKHGFDDETIGCIMISMVGFFSGLGLFFMWVIT